MNDHLFCFGLGYSAQVLAKRWLAGGGKVSGTVREAGRREALAAMGIETIVFDREHPLPPAALDGATHVLSSVPPDAAGDPVLDLGVSRLLERASGLRWIGYLSSTGVYGDWGGGMVDERSPLRATSPRALQRAKAEAGWLALAPRLPAQVFRLAGIYGPGRSALDDVRAGTARRIVKPGQMFGRIHVLDIATVLQAAAERGRGGEIYNVCDDEAAPPQDVIGFACDLLGVAPPPLIAFAEATLSPMAASFWADNRRVGNGKIKRDLNVALAYPSYREGLRALLAAGA